MLRKALCAPCPWLAYRGEVAHTVGELTDGAWADTTEHPPCPPAGSVELPFPGCGGATGGVFPQPDTSVLFLAAFYLPRSQPPWGMVTSICHWTCSQVWNKVKVFWLPGRTMGKTRREQNPKEQDKAHISNIIFCSLILLLWDRPAAPFAASLGLPETQLCVIYGEVTIQPNRG